MEKTLKVTGRAALSLPPDTVRLRMKQRDLHREYGEAVRLSAEHTAQVRRALAELGPEKVKTLSFRVDTEYESAQDEKGNWRQVFAGYRVVHALRAEFPLDRELLGRVLERLSQLPAGPELHVEYTLGDRESARRTLLAQAVESSRSRAQVLAAAAGVTLGEVLSIDYAWGPEEEVRPLYAAAEGAALRKNAALPIDLDPEDLTLEETVTILWRLGE